MTNQPKASDGNRLTVRQSSADTNGELLEIEARYPAHSVRPRSHYHPHQEERFEVLSGVFRAEIGGVEQTYQAGESFTVPANTSHRMHNVGDTDGCLLWQVRPAMKTQAFLETMWGLEADGKTNAGGVPNLLQLAVILQDFRNEFRASSPAYPVQRILVGILAPIGRLFGYRSRYDRYSKESA